MKQFNLNKLIQYFDHPRALFILFLFSFFSRVIMSFTSFSWAHPDEWYQTVELGNFISTGWMSFTEVMPLHYRNLTWPYLISWILYISEWLQPESVSTRLWLIRLSTACLDFLSLFGVYYLIKNLDFTRKQKNFVFFAVALFGPIISDVVRPSQEHLSQISFWFSLFFYFYALEKNKNNFWLMCSGIFCSLIAAFRYPSGLLSLGLVCFYFLFSPLNFRHKLYLLRGLFLGFILGGLADFMYYGRAYESLWMYLQYNVFTGLGQEIYGIQSIQVYWDLLAGRFKGPLILFLPFFIFYFFIGFYKSSQRKEIILLPFVFYCIGHFNIGHKESRFFMPIELLFYYFIWTGFFYFNAWLILKKESYHIFKKSFLFVFILLNIFFLFAGLRGEFLKKNWSYQYIDAALRSEKNTCAVVSIHRPYSTSIPTSKVAPSPAQAFFPYRESVPLSVHSKVWGEIPLIWIQKTPECQKDQKVLLHLPRVFIEGEEPTECALLERGIQSFFPKKQRSGVWYSCFSSVLLRFQKQETRKVLSSFMPRIETLPPYGMTSTELKNLTLLQSEPGIQDGVMVDW